MIILGYIFTHATPPYNLVTFFDLISEDSYDYDYNAVGLIWNLALVCVCACVVVVVVGLTCRFLFTTRCATTSGKRLGWVRFEHWCGMDERTIQYTLSSRSAVLVASSLKLMKHIVQRSCEIW